MLEHILDSHMPKLTHTHTSTLAHTYSKQSFSLAFANPFFLSSFRPPWLLSGGFFCGFFLRLLSLLSFFISFIASPSLDAFFVPRRHFRFRLLCGLLRGRFRTILAFLFSKQTSSAHLTPLATHTLAHTLLNVCVFKARERKREEERKNVIKGVGKQRRRVKMKKQNAKRIAAGTKYSMRRIARNRCDALSLLTVKKKEIKSFLVQNKIKSNSEKYYKPTVQNE